MKKACKESGIKISKYDAKKKKSKPKSQAGLRAELEANCLGQSVAPTTSQASFSSSPCEAGEREVRGAPSASRAEHEEQRGGGAKPSF